MAVTKLKKNLFSLNVLLKCMVLLTINAPASLRVVQNDTTRIENFTNTIRSNMTTSKVENKADKDLDSSTNVLNSSLQINSGTTQKMSESSNNIHSLQSKLIANREAAKKLSDSHFKNHPLKSHSPRPLLKSVSVESMKDKKYIKKEHENKDEAEKHSKVNSTFLHKERIDCSRFALKVENDHIKDFCYSPNDSLKCYQDPIFCQTYHLSGKRELMWPAYGEYSYLSHEHWVKVLQHGGVVFLYHPCANESVVMKLRQLAESCMHRYVLTPYQKLSSDKPLALVSWGCFLLMSEVDFSTCKVWIKSHAYKGPASHIHKNGTYEHQLVKAAKVITDIKDTFLCPDEDQKAALYTMPPSESTLKLRKHSHIGEEIIMKRLAKAKHVTRTHAKTNEPLPVDKKKAFTAFGSLVFLFILLLFLLLYTKLWTPKLNSGKFRYEKLGDLETECESEYYDSNFSLLKTSQDFISSLKRSKRDRKRDTYCKVKLLAPISEEEDDYD